jgi:hypothetical protein
VTHYTHDPAGRPSADTVTSLGDAGQNVDGTVRRLGTTYDDLGRVQQVTSYGDTAGTNVLNQVESEYNGWRQVYREYQEHNGAVDSSTLYVQYNYGTAAQGARLTSVRYPNGRLVHYTYGTAGSAADLLNRLDAIQDDNGSGQPGNTLASYKYLGTGTIVTGTRKGGRAKGSEVILLTTIRAGVEWGHATTNPGYGRGNGVPRAQPRRGTDASVPQSGRFRGHGTGAGGNVPANPRADPRLLLDVQPLAPVALAARGWRIVGSPAVADGDPYATLACQSPHLGERADLPGTIQVLSCTVG